MLVVGASSQAAVCELACGLHVGDGCHLAASSGGTEMEGPHAHCGHGMGMMQQAGHEAVACGDATCSHASIPVFVKSGSSAALIAGVQWVVVMSVPVELKVRVGSGDVVGGPPLSPGGVGLESVSLRV
jgi:hypothetical protein